ncbi:MAG: sulfatase-like hydrolase/transferase, partial [bacterium]|nr:sulfatase-like hydrolase/transferase [bacterium]
GWGDLPAYGHRNVRAHGGWTVRGELKTPHLDRMAREGTRFTQFYVASGVCSPSRAGIMTGQFPSRLGVHDYLARPELNRKRGVVDHLDPKVPTITRLLRKAGYTTAHFGKWHLGRGDTAPKPEAYGISRYDTCIRGPQGRVRSSERIADETIKFVEANRDRPFYINAWLYDPHSPLHPTEEMMAPYADLSPRWGEHKGALQVYYAVLTNLDRHIGRILTRLDQLGLSDNTVVIFSSDNGHESGLIPFVSHYGGAASPGPFRGLKRSLYEGGVRVPFIVRWPGKTPAGAVDNSTVISGVDFLPTIASLANVELPSDLALDGEDLSATLLGKPLGKAKPLMWENRYPVYGHVLDKSPMLAIRDGKWKLLINPDMSRVELYD